MKRVFLAVTILLLIIILCVVSVSTVSLYRHDFTSRIQKLEESIYSQNFEELAQHAASVSRAWEHAEHVLIRFVRHIELDEITAAMTRLEKLAKYGDLAEFSAELNRIKTLLNHIYDSEFPHLRNLL